MDKTRSDEFLKALISAYIWVASADDGVDETEYKKFDHVLVQSPFATQFETDHVRRYFKDMVAAFADDFDAAIELTLTRLKNFAGKSQFSEEIVRVCRSAVVADNRLAEAEELALAGIAGALASS